MTRAPLAPLSFLAICVLVVTTACAAKKRAVDWRDFEEVDGYVQKYLRDQRVPPEKRRAYVIEKLGPPHRTSGEAMYWYSPTSNCYYLQVGDDGWTSWGVGVTADCAAYAVMP